MFPYLVMKGTGQPLAEAWEPSRRRCCVGGMGGGGGLVLQQAPKPLETDLQWKRFDK